MPVAETAGGSVAVVFADSQPFDLARLGSRIEQVRGERGLTMTALSAEVGVAASTIRRFRTVAAPGRRGSRRTTIQRLARAAQASSRSVASLTRWSPF